jgi:hypothetical protein
VGSNPTRAIRGGRGVTAASWVVIPEVSVRIRPAALFFLRTLGTGEPTAL